MRASDVELVPEIRQVVAVYTKDVAETKARGTEAGRSKGYPLLFTTEPEE